MEKTFIDSNGIERPLILKYYYNQLDMKRLYEEKQNQGIINKSGYINRILNCFKEIIGYN